MIKFTPSSIRIYIKVFENDLHVYICTSELNLCHDLAPFWFTQYNEGGSAKTWKLVFVWCFCIAGSELFILVL